MGRAQSRRKYAVLRLASLTAALQAPQGESDISALKELGAELRAKKLSMNDLTTLNERYISMTAAQRVKLVNAAQSIQKPRCFGGVAAFPVVEEEGGGRYVVSRPSVLSQEHSA